jgi:hypothetical protein
MVILVNFCFLCSQNASQTMIVWLVHIVKRQLLIVKVWGSAHISLMFAIKVISLCVAAMLIHIQICALQRVTV